MGIAAVPLCGSVTTPAEPVAEPGDGVLLVCRASRLRRCWHPVVFSGQVGTAPAARTLLGTQVVLWRTPDGRLRSAVDRCPHRWAQLSAGTVTDGRLVCPYHGWQFGPDGAVVEIPQLEAGASLPPSACLQMLPTVEAYGMAWISLEPQPPATGPGHPRVRGLPVRPHRDRRDPLPRQRSGGHRQQHRLHPRRLRPLGLLRRGSRPACAGRERCNAPLSASRSATGRCRSPALPPRNDRAPGTR